MSISKTTIKSFYERFLTDLQKENGTQNVYARLDIGRKDISVDNNSTFERNSAMKQLYVYAPKNIARVLLCILRFLIDDDLTDLAEWELRLGFFVEEPELYTNYIQFRRQLFTVAKYDDCKILKKITVKPTTVVYTLDRIIELFQQS